MGGARRWHARGADRHRQRRTEPGRRVRDRNAGRRRLRGRRLTCRARARVDRCRWRCRPAAARRSGRCRNGSTGRAIAPRSRCWRLATLGQPVTIQRADLAHAAAAAGADSGAGGCRRQRCRRICPSTCEALRLRVALWPLIGGHVDARELVLRGPDLRIPWPAEPGVLRPRPPAWLAAFAARIENGRLTIGTAGLHRHRRDAGDAGNRRAVRVRHGAVQRPGLAFHRAADRGGGRWLRPG